ncbi:unnamed protein product [Oncorhynchus mykiss]|uniref:Uncharacterized protein n=1 Tax=Oncorhynchus mykiss TaxID=8022 RepID=A0A060W3R3_ONCMY|nr:unnamed protein product [Oncorhynchus mykiss]
MTSMCFVSLVMYFLAVSCLTWADYAPDEVTELPGMSFKPNYRYWSGYLKASPGKFLHYWFVTSQRDPLKDPVVLCPEWRARLHLAGWLSVRERPLPCEG